MKTIHVIVYLPGYAGNFLQFLLSIDEMTYPWIPKTAETNDRSEAFYYKDLIDAPRQWFSYHRNMPSTYDAVRGFLQSEHSVLINIAHPAEFTNFKFLPITTSFLSVSLSPENERFVSDFKARTGGPILRPGEIEQNLDFIEKFSPFDISLDRIIAGEDSFIAEYERVSAHLKLPTHNDKALDMYRIWRAARQF